jgi:hypothetical protein
MERVHRALAAAVQSVDSSTVQEEYNTTAVVTDAVRIVGTGTSSTDSTSGDVSDSASDSDDDSGASMMPVIIAVAAVLVLAIMIYVCKFKKTKPADNGPKDAEVVKAGGLEQNLGHHVLPTSNV